MSVDAPHVLGIDIGGTKTALAFIKPDDGTIALRRQFPTPPRQLADEAFMDRVETEVRELLDEIAPGSLAAIGLGLCELVDLEGNVKSGHRVQWQGLPVRQRLARIGPAIVESDVRAAALAEARLGAGRGFDQFLYLNVGTGVSSCLVLGGRPHAGARGHALVMASGTWSCRCPHCGGVHDITVEDMSGGSGMARRYNERSNHKIEGAGELLALCEAGDHEAQRVIADAAMALGSALGLALGMLDPEALVIGGGLGAARGAYWDALVAQIRGHIWSEETRALPILRAELGADAGVIGAGLAAWAAQGISSPKFR